MATSPVEICNSALLNLGRQPIGSLSEAGDPGDVQAKVLAIKWPEVRDAVLTEIRPRSLRRRAELAREKNPPEFGYAYRYKLPSDYVILLAFNPPEHPFSSPCCGGRVLHDAADRHAAWDVEGNCLLTNEERANLLYIGYDRTADNVSQIGRLTTSALIARLAAEIAPGLGEPDAVNSWLGIYEMRKVEAVASEGWEGSRKIASCPAFLGAR